MNNIICLDLGDWSGDGHGITSSIYIKSSLSKEELEIAYREGTKIVGFDFINEVTEEYEDSTLKLEHQQKLYEKGIDIWGGEPTEDIEYLETRTFAEIYLEICKLGISVFNYEIFRLPTLHIGGYGLFSQ